MPEEYRVQLDVFTGPLDLLLYLIRRDELDIQDIPIARLTEQYLDYVRLLEQIDPNAAGDFLVMASTLVELKSRALLPTPPIESDETLEDPRSLLVRQLLEYKRFKDAAKALGTAAEERARRYVRVPAELPPDLQGVELEQVELWDLLAALRRVMDAIGARPGEHEVVLDDTPIEEYAEDILRALRARSPLTFAALFDAQASRARIIGLFLALLELIRLRRVRAEQDRLAGEIYLFLLIEVSSDADEPAAGRPDDKPAAGPPDETVSGRDSAAEPGSR